MMCDKRGLGLFFFVTIFRKGSSVDITLFLPKIFWNMKIKMFIFTLILFTPILAFSEWKTPSASLRNVFSPKGKSGNTELIRLYSDLTFEHLIYAPTKNSTRRVVTINHGTYTFRSGKLALNPVGVNFQTDRYSRTYIIENSKAYANKWQSLFKKDAYILRTVSKSSFDMPYFLDPSTLTVVGNSDAAEMVDLKALSSYFSRKTKSKRELIEKITEFLRNSIKFDEEATETEVADILGGSARSASSLGVSKCVNELLNPADVSARPVNGYLKKSASDVGATGKRHSWNRIQIGDFSKLFDVFLGEDWNETDPGLMIYTHFPDLPEDQLLEEPVNIDQFMQMPYAIPTYKGAKGAVFLPLKGKLTARGELKLIFNGYVQISSVQQQKVDCNGNINDPEVIRNFKTASAQDKTVFSVPLNYQESLIIFKTSDGMQIFVQVLNNGVEENDITSYYVKNAKRRLVIPQPKKESKTAEKEVVIVADQSLNNSSLTNNQLKMVMDLGDFYRKEMFSHPLIKQAVAFYGLKEIPGDLNDKNIMMFFKESGNRSATSDEDAWCSVFISYCAKKAGASFTKKATAKSWLNVGEHIAQPTAGDIVVFWREDPDSWKGHVAIYLGKDPATGNIICLGGNQDDEVNVRMYDSNNVLGYRRIIE
jgi:uncharacterized protein (TIGR02594 family)